jgi:hypothetical protein
LSAATRQMHLGVFVLGAGNHSAGWRWEGRSCCALRRLPPHGSRAERRALVERTDPALPVSQQCRLLAVSRSSVYRQPTEVSEVDGAIIALIDRQYLARPYYRAGWQRGWRPKVMWSIANGSGA